MHALDLYHRPATEFFGGVATVVRESERGFTIAVDGERYTARRARSCLLEPREGDRVLFGGAPRGELYVLAILDREDAATEIAVDGDLHIRARQGSCELTADRAVSLAGGERVAVAAGTLEVRAMHGELFVDALAYVGRRLGADIDAIKTVARHVDRLAESVRERMQRSYRTVEDLDQTRAGAVDIAATSSLRVHARHALVTARELVKIAGEQIHLG